jgi:hypothetical protein
VSTTPAQVPVTITPEVRAYVAELGMEAEFEQMLDYVLHHVADMQSLHISLAEPYDSGDVPCVLFDAHLMRAEPVFDGTQRHWHEWFRSHFPQKALGRFHLMFVPPGPDHAG